MPVTKAWNCGKQLSKASTNGNLSVWIWSRDKASYWAGNSYRWGLWYSPAENAFPPGFQWFKPVLLMLVSFVYISFFKWGQSCSHIVYVLLVRYHINMQNTSVNLLHFIVILWYTWKKVRIFTDFYGSVRRKKKPQTPYSSVLIRTHPYPSVPIRTHPYSSVLIRTHPYSSVLIRTHPYPSVLIRTHPYSSVLIRTNPYSSVLIRTNPY